jgi:hypothetical protein
VRVVSSSALDGDVTLEVIEASKLNARLYKGCGKNVASESGLLTTNLGDAPC